jgi:hypothetical protein
MNVAAGETGYDLDNRAHQLLRGVTEDGEKCGECGWNLAAAGSPDCNPANCSSHPTPCGVGSTPAYTSDVRAE